MYSTQDLLRILFHLCFQYSNNIPKRKYKITLILEMEKLRPKRIKSHVTAYSKVMKEADSSKTW